jgi:hypothetical protein
VPPPPSVAAAHLCPHSPLAKWHPHPHTTLHSLPLPVIGETCSAATATAVVTISVPAPAAISAADDFYTAAYNTAFTPTTLLILANDNRCVVQANASIWWLKDSHYPSIPHVSPLMLVAKCYCHLWLSCFP